MQRNTLFSFLTIAAFGLLTAGQANAETYTWVGGAGSGAQQTDWDYDAALFPPSNFANWSWGAGGNVTSLPNSGDSVVIPDVTYQPILDINATFSTLTIDASADMTVSGVTLTLDGTTAHDIDGLLILSNSSSSHLKFSDSVSISGTNGVIQLNHASSEIRIGNGKTVTLAANLRIKGMGKMVRESGGSSTTSFVNNGTLRANAAGVLSLGPNLSVSGSGAFEAKLSSSAELQFNKAATSLTGKFVLCGDATIRFKATVDTTGCYDESSANGWLRFENSSSFSHDDNTCAGGSANTINSDTEYTGSCSE